MDSPDATASAASSVQPPANTESLPNRVLSGPGVARGSSRELLSASAGGALSYGHRASRARGSLRASPISAPEREYPPWQPLALWQVCLQRVQISPMARAFWAVNANVGSWPRARARNSRADSEHSSSSTVGERSGSGALRGGTGHLSSPPLQALRVSANGPSEGTSRAGHPPAAQ